MYNPYYDEILQDNNVHMTVDNVSKVVDDFAKRGFNISAMVSTNYEDQVKVSRTLYMLATRTFDFRNDYDLVYSIEELE